MSFEKLDRVRTPRGDGVVLSSDARARIAWVTLGVADDRWFAFDEIEKIYAQTVEVRLNEFDSRHWHELMARFRDLLTVLDDEDLSPEGTKAVEQLLRVIREGPEDLVE